MDSVRLLDRTDTKFIAPVKVLDEILPKVNAQYTALSLKRNKISDYQTLYFDTPEFQFYLNHHNGKLNRFKVRIRKYVQSELSFLEIKHKYKGRTIKSRVQIDDFEYPLSEASTQFVNAALGKTISLENKLWNSFSRITLVDQIAKERVTIDQNLKFEHKDKKANYPNICIIEVKQAKQNRKSTLIQMLRESRIRPSRISKYCAGTTALYPHLKYNNFKETLMKLKKVNDI